MRDSTTPLFGSRMAAIPPSGTLEVMGKVRTLRRQGIDVISLAGGLPEPGPDCLTKPIRFAPERNTVGDPAGQIDLRTGIAAKLARDQGLGYDPETEIVVTVGAKQGVYLSLVVLIEPGDEVLVHDPCWVSYAPAVQLAGGVPKAVSFSQAGGFHVDAAAFAEKVGPRTRVIILNTPHNPTCRVFTKEELEGVARVALDHNLWVLSDESFDKFVFDNHRHLSIANLPAMRDRTIVLQSFSKAFALPSIRVGYLGGPEAVCRAVARANEHVITCVSPVAQSIALSALTDEAGWTERLQSHYRLKRDFVLEELERIPGMKFSVPEGTFYVFADISSFGMTSNEFAGHLLDQARVAVTPGSAFGSGAEGYVRINLVGSIDLIREGLDRVRRVLCAT